MNVTKPNISIIITVYNVEKFLVRCLDSIFSQQFSGSFEVIAVDDASVDNSLNILKEYQEKEARLIIVEHKFNKKVSIARETGMKVSRGEYIMHIDSDDWLLSNALEKLYKKCIETDADVIVFNYIKENNFGIRTYVNSINKELITTNKLQVQKYFYSTPWNKIVKKKLTENMICGEVGINMTEDLLYATEILLKAEKICLITESCYVYFENIESLTSNIKPVQLLEIQKIILQQIKLITLKYDAPSPFINNILSYLEKGIYLAISQSIFFINSENKQNNDLINAFRLFPEMTDKRLNKLSMAMSNKYYSFFQVFLRFGIKPVLGIILRRIRK